MRWNLILSAGLLVLSEPAVAQPVPDAASNTPATDAIGPRELQDFTLPGTAAKPAEQSPPATPVARPAEQSGQVSNPEGAPLPKRQTLRRETKIAASAAPAVTARTTRVSNPSVSSPSQSIPRTAVPVAAMPLAATSAAVAPAPARLSPTPSAAPEQRLSLLPWLLAALALAAGATFVFWRRKGLNERLAGAGNYDPFVAPEPVPAARGVERAPTPVPEAAAPRQVEVTPAAVPRGIVSSRLRPSLELGMQPLSCLVDDEQVTIEFEVELFNSGTAPARAVIAEASLLNASATHEQELAAFYAKAPADGDRIDSIPPMRRMTFKNRVVAPRAAVQEYELAGRRAFVPVLAFNAQYEWSGGKGQSSLAFLLGRETRGEKLGPLHLDGAQREVRHLGARVLPTAVRT